MLTFRCDGCGAFNRAAEERLDRGPVCGRCKQRLDVTSAPQEVDSVELEHVLAVAPVPVLVDFWAPWCGPCRLAAPILDRIARARAGRIVVLKVNSDANPDASRRYGVSGIPAFVAFRNGAEASRQVGLLPEPAFARWVDGVSFAAA